VTRIAVLSLALVLAAVACVHGSRATFTASATNPGASFATASDWVAPAVTLSTPADGAYVTTLTPSLSGAAGTATGDSSTVTVKIYAGTAATGTPVQTLTRTASAGAWSGTAASLTNGSTYTAQASQSDSAGNTGVSSPHTFTVDTTAPTATAIAAANGGTTAGKIETGDSVTFTYSEAISPATVLSAWSGSSTAVKFKVTDSSSNDSFTVLDSAGGTTVHLGSVATAGNYVTTTATFAATMVRSADGKSVTVTLGALQSGTIASSAVTGRNMTWTVNTTVKDLAGNAVTTTSVVQSGNGVDF
jgi:Bacterial Ig-like domain